MLNSLFLSIALLLISPIGWTQDTNQNQTQTVDQKNQVDSDFQKMIEETKKESLDQSSALVNDIKITPVNTPAENNTNSNYDLSLRWSLNTASRSIVFLSMLLTPLIFYRKNSLLKDKNTFIVVDHGFSWFLYAGFNFLLLLTYWIIVFTTADKDCYSNCSPYGINIFCAMLYLVWCYFFYRQSFGCVINKKDNTVEYRSGIFSRTKFPIENISSCEQKEEFYQNTNKKGEVESGYIYFINILTRDGNGFEIGFGGISIDSDVVFSYLNTRS